MCGLHTVLELLSRAKAIGLKGFAVTDHGQTLGGRLNSVFFERFESPDPSIRIFKGVECNLLDEKGAIDLPRAYLKYLDIVLCGIHPNIAKGLSSGSYTDMLLRALRLNPEIDIITHPNDPVYPVDYRRLAEGAKESGCVLELNNSKVRYARSSESEAVELIAACRECGCPIAVNSDTHAILELGDDSAVVPLLEKTGFPEELIVNRSIDAALDFAERRRIHKRSSIADVMVETGPK